MFVLAHTSFDSDKLEAGVLLLKKDDRDRHLYPIFRQSIDKQESCVDVSDLNLTTN